MDAQNTKNRINFRLNAIAVNLAIVFLCVPMTGLAQEPAPNAGPYAIYGVVPDAGCCSEFGDPVGSIKELGPVNASTTKLGNIHLAAPPMLQFTNPNSSTDLAKIWLETGKAIGADGQEDVWLYFAWERETNSGSSVISYEFQKQAADPACDYSAIDQTEPASAEETTLMNSCNPWSNRQIGDFMIVWDFGGGATDIILRRFTATGFDAGVNVSLDGNAVAALNVDSTRGEGAINLSETIFAGLESCFNIANVIPGTVTGNSDQADYKDTVLADVSSAVTISNCGTVNITKDTDPEGLSGNFEYTLDRIEGGTIDFGGTTYLTGGTLLDDGGSDQVIVVPGNDYRLQEDLTTEPNYRLQSIYCDKPISQTVGQDGFMVNAAETTDCVITNELLMGSITVIKTVLNGYGGSASPGDFCFDLNDDEQTAPFPGQDVDGTTFTFEVGNTYEVSEEPCGSPDASPQGYKPTMTGDCAGTIQADMNKVCTIVNEQQEQLKVGVTLFKNLIDDNGGTTPRSAWTLNATLKTNPPGPCTVSSLSGPDVDGGGVAGSLSVSDGVAQCVYVLSETGGPTSGYTASDWSCSGDIALNGNEFTVGADGGTCSTCTFVNDDDTPSLTLIKEVTNDNGGTAVPGDWTLTAAGYDSASPDAGTYSLSTNLTDL
jgi:hypothetical protein